MENKTYTLTEEQLLEIYNYLKLVLGQLETTNEQIICNYIPDDLEDEELSDKYLFVDNDGAILYLEECMSMLEKITS